MTDAIKIGSEHAQRWTGAILRVGLWISSATMMAGLALLILHGVNGSTMSPTLLTLLKEFAAGQFSAAAVLFLGLLMLMFTPFLRVLAMLLGFAAEKDWRCVAVAAIVLLLLTGEVFATLW